jgi:hypothetical protein
MTATELVPTMTPEDAQEHHKALRGGLGQLHARLYIMHTLKGFMQFADSDGKHYETIGDYAASELDLAKSTAYDWVNQVQVTIDGKGISIEDLTKSLKSGKKGDALLPTTVTRKLGQLPTAELRQTAYKTMEELKTSQTMTAPEYDREWGKLTNRLMVGAGLRVAPGRPPKAETNGSEATAVAKTVPTPDLPELSPSVDRGATVEHSERQEFEFDDGGNAAGLTLIDSDIFADRVVLRVQATEGVFRKLRIEIDDFKQMYEDWDEAFGRLGG